MKDVKSILIMKSINRMITKGNTGTPEQFVDRIHISRSNFYRYIKTMKKYGAPIAYSRSLKTFYYSKAGTFEVGFSEY